MSWIDDISGEALKRAGGASWRSGDDEAWDARVGTINSAYRSTITSPVDGAAPKRTSYLSMKPANYTGDSFTTAGYNYDSNSYINDMYSYMRASENYADWSDEDIKTFVSDTANASDAEMKSERLWTENSIAYKKAQKDAEADRNSMLAELATYKDTMLSSNYVNEMVGQEAGRWNARNQGILNTATQQMANMGRTVSPYLLGELSRRLQAQAAASIQEVRISAEQQQEQKRQYYLSAINSVYANTKREVMDPVTASALIKQISTGSGSAGGGSGSSASAGGGGSSSAAGGSSGTSSVGGRTITTTRNIDTGNGTSMTKGRYSWEGTSQAEDNAKFFQGFDPVDVINNVPIAWNDPIEGIQIKNVPRSEAYAFWKSKQNLSYGG